MINHIDWTGTLPSYLCVLKQKHVGSTYVCNPAPTDTDIDLLLLVNDQALFAAHLIKEDWSIDYKYDLYKPDFLSLKKDFINLIITNNRNFFNRFALAAEICKELNLLDKKDRIMIHDAFIKNRSPNIESDFEDIPF